MQAVIEGCWFSCVVDPGLEGAILLAEALAKVYECCSEPTFPWLVINEAARVFPKHLALGALTKDPLQGLPN